MSTAIEKSPPSQELIEEAARLLQDTGQTSTYNPRLATAFIKWASQNTNLVSPAMAAPNLPLGFELAFTRIDINPDPAFKEVYKQSDGGLSLTKVGLEKIQKGAGIRMDPKLTRKLDNGSDPLFCIYEFVGYYRDFDSTTFALKGTKELDLHDGSPEVLKIRGRQRSEAAGNNEINELRRFISGHAETKAKLRAIRSFGLKSSYSSAELSRPFTCIRLIRTGRCEDLEMQRLLTLSIHDEFKMSEAMLFGGPAGPGGAIEQLPGAEVRSLPAGPATEPDLGNEQPATDNPVTSASDIASDIAEGQSTPRDPKNCTPTHCHGADPDAVHVKACFAPVGAAAGAAGVATEQSTPAQPVEPGWIITDGELTGIAINDEAKVTPERLSGLLDLYTSMLEGSGDLSEQDVGRIKFKRGKVEAELTRRGIN